MKRFIYLGILGLVFSGCYTKKEEVKIPPSIPISLNNNSIQPTLVTVTNSIVPEPIITNTVEPEPVSVLVVDKAEETVQMVSSPANCPTGNCPTATTVAPKKVYYYQTQPATQQYRRGWLFRRR